MLAGDVGGLLLLDVTPHSLGIEVVGDVMSVLIPRNSTLPTTKSDIYTVSPMQTTVEINVLQGESPKASENTSLGKFMLGGLRLGMKKPQVEVTSKSTPTASCTSRHVTSRPTRPPTSRSRVRRTCRNARSRLRPSASRTVTTRHQQSVGENAPRSCMMK